MEENDIERSGALTPPSKRCKIHALILRLFHRVVREFCFALAWPSSAKRSAFSNSWSWVGLFVTGIAVDELIT